MKVKGQNNALRTDAKAFDEIRIITVPRYKTSGLSGDEWRISAKVQLLRKGTVCYETSFSNVKYACAFLAYTYETAISEGKAFFAGDGILCDQEGCLNHKTITYQLVNKYCSDGHAHDIQEWQRPLLRHFCGEHKIRGDSSLEDCDRNYVEVKINGK